MLFAIVFLGTALQANAATFISDETPVAVFDFVEKGGSHKINGAGEKVSSLLYAYLSADSNLILVDREELDRIEAEILLNMSGVVDSKQAIQVGQLTGAKVLITGTVFEIDNNLMMVAKIIGVETSRVVGVHTRGNEESQLIDIAMQLAREISTTLQQRSKHLIAPVLSQRDRLADLASQLANKEKPSISVKVTESHISRRVTPDPAAETEIIQYLISSGFEVIDASSEAALNADLALTGEGFTEFATRKGDLVGVRARVEIKVVENASKRVIAADRQTEIELNLSEVLAGKSALEQAAAKIAERVLPQLAVVDE